MTLSAPFAQVLAAGRESFNARVVAAKRRYPGLDPNAFALFLQASVDPLIVAVAAVAPHSVAPVTVAAYDMALELVGQTLAGPGARTTYLDQLWRQLAPHFAGLIAQQPLPVLGALSNAMVNLSKVADARCELWLSEMTRLSVHATTLAALQTLGQITAWRCGLAHFRLGALQLADQLEPRVALAAFGLTDGDWPSVYQGLLADPWWAPGAAVRSDLPIGVEVGQFAGFAGWFSQPPEVRACHDGFLIKSAERYSYLLADGYGSVLHAATVQEFAAAASFIASVDAAKLPLIKGSGLLLNGLLIDLELPAGSIAVTCNAHTVAVTSPYTHAIRLFARQC